MTTVGMIGSGTLARAIAVHAVRAGHQVMFSNARGTAALGDLVTEMGAGAVAGTVVQAAAADIVVLAVNWTHVPDALAGLPPRPGRILVDATNQWLAPPPQAIMDRLEVGGSELVASLLPDAHVIKAFGNMYGPVIAADPVTDAGRRILFYAGDDGAAKKRFRALVDSFGFAPIDLGPLKNGRLLQVDGPLTGVHAIREPIGHPVLPNG
ncbi:NADPH-dependent F420 reductase [Mycobacterium sp. WMMD1722]|uniref:NADPH-dependent F420 reductase n=1 Tax=Mycobacterium sp. WMMD1722 TaxID=3404117 RepID=UPI003BF4B028